MCGRVRLSSDYSEIKIRLKFAPNSVAPNFEPDWNKPPTAPMLVAIRSVNGERVPKMMKWGLIPHWAKDDKLQFSTFNARAEEFTTKPAFRDAWKRGLSDALLSLTVSTSGKSLMQRESSSSRTQLPWLATRKW
jgi:putative SOS response-associated peptidase YedK